MPGLLRWDAFNQLERIEDETDQFGTSSKAFWKTTTQEPGATATERFEPLPPGTFCTTAFLARPRCSARAADCLIVLPLFRRKHTGEL